MHFIIVIKYNASSKSGIVELTGEDDPRLMQAYMIPASQLLLCALFAPSAVAKILSLPGSMAHRQRLVRAALALARHRFCPGAWHNRFVDWSGQANHDALGGWVGGWLVS